jgi:oligopeptide transport system substrate-binding protein
MRFSAPGEPKTTDPQKLSDTADWAWGKLAFEGLLDIDEHNQLVLAAAEQIAVSSDGLKYTLTLRNSLTYSDGKPLTAYNFEYAYRRLFDPRITGRDYATAAYVIKGAQDLSGLDLHTVAAANVDTVVAQLIADLGVKALDDKHIQFTLREQAAYFPYILTMAGGWPVRQDMVEQGGPTWTEPATYIGNGPYVLKQWNHGSGALWAANPYYRTGKPKIDRLEVLFIGAAVVGLQAYKLGEIDWLDLGTNDVPAAQADPTLRGELVQVPGACTDEILFNVNKPPFDNIKVRQLFVRAIDRADWVETIGQGVNIAAINAIPPGRPGYEPDVRQAEFDPRAAKAMLDAVLTADYPAGLPLRKLSFPDNPLARLRMEWVQDQLLNNLGIFAELEPLDPKAYTQMLRNPATAPQLSFTGWCQDYPDPQNWLSTAFRSDSQMNTTGWHSEQFDQLTRQADKEQDPETRRRLYKQAHQILIDESPVLFLQYRPRNVLIKPYMKGMREHVSSSPGFMPGISSIEHLDIQR